MPALSVVVPAYNSEKTIEPCLQAVRRSDYADYELLVVDCHSGDRTAQLARTYADQVIDLSGKRSRACARRAGAENAKGGIIVNIDSDVQIRADTLRRIADFFTGRRDADAVTGLLAKETLYGNFCSRYKNLYMHYLFKKLPEEVTFLYGSIYAIRKACVCFYEDDALIADDTALGQKLVLANKKIIFLKELEVIHLKKYDLWDLLKNDFSIPFDWAQIFLRYDGWKQIGKRGTGYAHSPKGQLASVLLAPAILTLCLTGNIGTFSGAASLILFSLWFFLNMKFFRFLATEQGYGFGIGSVFLTFFDHLTMALGIMCGSAVFLMTGSKRDRVIA